jgi:hypothetical protein
LGSEIPGYDDHGTLSVKPSHSCSSWESSPLARNVFLQGLVHSSLRAASVGAKESEHLIRDPTARGASQCPNDDDDPFIEPASGHETRLTVVAPIVSSCEVHAGKGLIRSPEIQTARCQRLSTLRRIKGDRNLTYCSYIYTSEFPQSGQGDWQPRRIKFLGHGMYYLPQDRRCWQAGSLAFLQ